MSSSKSNKPSFSLYPQVDLSNPEAALATSSPPSSSSLYPTIDASAPEIIFTDSNDDVSPTPEPQEQILIKLRGAIVHLIEKDNKSIQLANGDFSIVSLRQGENTIAVFARVGDEIQWPLAKDEPAVKLDGSRYFFTLRVPIRRGEDSSEDDEDECDSNSAKVEILNYGLTIASKGQEGLVKELDKILECYSCFSVKKVNKGKGNDQLWEVFEKSKEVSPDELKVADRRKEVEENSAAFWTTLAPNVEDYSSCVARAIAAGSGQVIRGILWCGDVTVDRLNWGNQFLSRRMGPGKNSEVSKDTLKRIKRVKRLTKSSEKVANGILSGVVKVSGFFASSVVNSKVGKKLCSLLPGEIVLASLDGFNKVCDAVEVAGRNVMSTTSVVTTDLVSQRYGEQAGKVTNEGFEAAGHAIGTAWAVFKIRKALNPKSAIKPTTIAKAAAKASAAEQKAKKK